MSDIARASGGDVATVLVRDMRVKHQVEHEHTAVVAQYEPVDIAHEISVFPLIPSSGRVYVVQAEVEKTGGGLYIPASAKKEGEMQTNFGWVVGVAEDVTFCKLGDKVFYGRFSGSWVMDMAYRVMNEVDILGKFKEKV